MKKGFTLVELLAVLVILGVIIAITVPAIGTIIKTSKEKSYDKQTESIITAARSYMTENSIELPDEGTPKTLTICELKKAGYLKKENIINPLYQEGSSETNKKCKYLYGNITVTNIAGKFRYVYSDLANCEEKNNIQTDVNICD